MQKYFVPVIILLTLGAGCAKQPSNDAPSGEGNAPKSTPVSYYISPSQNDKTKFCNGGDMDSAGYKGALTTGVSTSVLGTLSTEDKIKVTLQKAVAVSGTFDEVYARTASTTFSNGTVTMYPAGGFAGVSIFMCAWQPFVEKQLEQFPEVKKIEWKPIS